MEKNPFFSLLDV